MIPRIWHSPSSTHGKVKSLARFPTKKSKEPQKRCSHPKAKTADPGAPTLPLPKIGGEGSRIFCSACSAGTSCHKLLTNKKTESVRLFVFFCPIQILCSKKIFKL
jgi:hypothetical protein